MIVRLALSTCLLAGVLSAFSLHRRQHSRRSVDSGTHPIDIQVHDKLRGHAVVPDITGISAVDYLGTGVTLRWTYHGDNPAGYYSLHVTFVLRYRRYHEVERSQPDEWQLVESPTTTAFLVNLTALATYEVQITAKHKINQKMGQWSAPSLFTVRNPSIPEMDVPRPTDFEVAAVAADSLWMTWQYEPQRLGRRQAELYFEISWPKAPGVMQKAFTERTTGGIVIQSFKPGQGIDVSIRAQLTPTEHSDRVTQQVFLPSEDDFVSVGDVGVMRDTDDVTRATIKWKVPDSHRHLIKGFYVSYSDETSSSRSPSTWNRVFTTNTQVTLDHLEADQAYAFRIYIALNNVATLLTTRQTFQFRTAQAQLIETVGVRYSRGIEGAIIEWQLKHNVPDITAFDVWLSSDPQQPHAQWDKHRVAGDSKFIRMTNLDADTRYHFRIDIILTSGKRIVGTKIYNFKSLDQHSIEMSQPKSLSYRNVGEGAVSINWQLPEPNRIAPDVIGYLIMYSTNAMLPRTEWMKLLLTDATRNSITITGLASDTTYFVQILPRYSDHTYPNPQFGAVFQFKTDPRPAEHRAPVTNRLDTAADGDAGSLTMPETTVLSACHGRSLTCVAPDETCVSVSDTEHVCVPHRLLTAVRNS